MKSHFIDLDIILKTESKPWIVSKDNPNIPIMKMEPHDFKIFQQLSATKMTLSLQNFKSTLI